MNTQSKVLWQTNRAAVAYSFLANVAIFIGYGYMQKDLSPQVLEYMQECKEEYKIKHKQ